MSIDHGVTENSGYLWLVNDGPANHLIHFEAIVSKESRSSLTSYLFEGT